MLVARILFLSIFFLGACSDSTVLEYNNVLASKQVEIEQAIDSLSKSIERADIVEIEKKYYATQKKILSGYELVDRNPAYELDSSFSKEFDMYCKNYEKELVGLVSLVKSTYQIPDSEYTYSRHKKLEKKLLDFNEFRIFNLSKLGGVQLDFALKYDYQIEDE